MEINRQTNPDGSSVTSCTKVYSRKDQKAVLDQAVQWVAGRTLSNEETEQIGTELSGSMLLTDGTLFNIQLNGVLFEQTFRHPKTPDRIGTVVFSANNERATVIEGFR